MSSREGVEDLQPTSPAARTWDWRTFAAAWLAMVINPASLSSGASLLSLGLTVIEASVAHLVGGIILWVALVASAWPGAKYGIPFPVVCRAAFGVLGAHFCTLSRGAVALMWLSFQLWQATLGLHEGIGRVAGPRYLEWGRVDAELTLAQLLLLLAFVLLHAAAIAFGVRRFRSLIFFTTPVQLVGFGIIIVWISTLCPFDVALTAADSGNATTMHGGSPYAKSHILGWLAAINASVSTWSTLVLVTNAEI